MKTEKIQMNEMASVDSLMRLTTASVPISRAVMHESGLHLSLLLKPAPSENDLRSEHEGANDSTSTPHADEIGRCRECQAYMNAFTIFEERGYVCTCRPRSAPWWQRW